MQINENWETTAAPPARGALASPVFLLAAGAIIGRIGAARGPETKDVDFH